nr:UvrD/REP helicase [Methylocystis sp. SC2]
MIRRARHHLETLNSQQRRAAEHGVEGQSAHPGPVLLVIVGAGSGKSAEGVRHVYASRMRFIPDSILSLFTRRAWPTIAPEAELASTGIRSVRLDVGARMRKMWR